MCKVDSLMLFFGRVGSSWGHRAFFSSSWEENVITPKYFILFLLFVLCYLVTLL